MPKDLALLPPDLAEAFAACRVRTLAWCDPLSAEDMCVQTMADVSPTKWHLAHSTWFWETFLLKPFAREAEPYDPRFNYLFNSYYELIGARHPRPCRGQITRPSIDEVIAYRDAVDEAALKWIAQADTDVLEQARPVILTGLAHEE